MSTEWTPETLNEQAARLREIYRDWLVRDDDPLSPFAAEHLLLAITALNSAVGQLRLAALHQTREVASRRLGT